MKSAPKSRRNSPARLQLEQLEARLQPSGLQHVSAGLPQAPVGQTGVVSPVAGPQAAAPPAVEYGTYVTGTPVTATGRGVAVDASDNQFVTGQLDNGMTRSAYLRKYLPNGTPDPTFTFVALRVSVGGVLYDTDAHGVAVDPTTGNVEQVGTAVDPATGNHVGFFAQYSPAGTLLNIAAYGNDLNPNSFDSVTVDPAGDVAFTGTLSAPALGYSELAVGALPAGGSLAVLPYNLSMTAGSAGLGIAVDSAGTTAYVAGFATPAAGGFQEGVVGRIDRNNPTALTYRPITNPGGNVAANAVAVNASGVYFAATLPGIAAVARFDPTLATVLNEYDVADPTVTFTALTLDGAGNVYVTGQSLNAATGNLTAQLTQFDGALNLLNTAQVGGSGTDAGLAVAVKSTGSVVEVGTTSSADFPATDGTTLNGTTDAFLVSYNFSY
jgi:sugar lactone lactonase YvrE